MAQAQGNENMGMQIGRVFILLPASSSVAATLHLYYLVIFFYITSTFACSHI